jgi:hypothetical protein
MKYQNPNPPRAAAMRARFNVLETQNIIDGQANIIAGEANITLIPRNSELLGQLVAATQTPKAAVK